MFYDFGYDVEFWYNEAEDHQTYLLEMAADEQDTLRELELQAVGEYFYCN